MWPWWFDVGDNELVEEWGGSVEKHLENLDVHVELRSGRKAVSTIAVVSVCARRPVAVVTDCPTTLCFADSVADPLDV